MSKYFYCRHCGRKKRKNLRLKIKQSYCGSRACQQARKNKWEREKKKKDPVFRERRKAQKLHWREMRPDDVYQRNYRENHPDYEISNREQQRERNNRTKMQGAGNAESKIVKTDALTSITSVYTGLYELHPYQKDLQENIVKTDVLIVELKTYKGLEEILPARPG